ncbi:MAG: AAA family ATPase [Chloroflexi bacterium]|nr:AAA family ATPase [Chloroflexota bacterium]
MAAGPRTPRAFDVNPDDQSGEPLCLGLMGPPGGGKTVSALRIASGIARVRGGKPALIDTEAGRARKYLISRNPEGFDFDYIPFTPPFEPASFLDAIHAAAKLNPAAIIVDNASDEHEGPGGVLDWHDRNVPNMGGNEWAAWNAPKASRRVLTAGIQQIKIPIIMTFRARPKTKTNPGSKTPVQMGYMPIAGDELLGIMDLTCLLPPRSNGVALWGSDKAGEDFVIKLPNYLARYIRKGAPLDEELGEALARWQRGEIDQSSPRSDAGGGGSGGPRKRSPAEMADSYVTRVNGIEDRDQLRAFQSEEGTVKFVNNLKDKHPSLYDRVVEANSRRAGELQPADDDDDAGFPEDPALSNPGGE